MLEMNLFVRHVVRLTFRGARRNKLLNLVNGTHPILEGFHGAWLHLVVRTRNEEKMTEVVV